MEDRKHWDSTAASKNPKPNPRSQKLLQKNFSYRKIVLMSLPPAILKARSVAKITVPCLDSAISRDFAFQHPLWKLCLHEGHRSSHKYQVTEGRTDGYGKGVGWERSIVKQRLRSASLEEQGKGSRAIHPVSLLQMLEAANELCSTPAIIIISINWLKWLHGLERCQLLHLSHLYLQS